MYDYANTVELSTKSKDYIAKVTIQRFNEATRWQSLEMVGNVSLRETLRNCYDQANGILPCRDKEIVEALGVDTYVNLTANKTGIVKSYLLESLVQAGSIPWVIEPTPIPDLSESGRMEVLEKVENEIYTGGFDGDLTTLIAEVKKSTLDGERAFAKTAAANMERLITDQCMEGGWNNAMYGFIDNFVDYPFAVLQGPVPVRRPRLTWGSTNPTVKYETFYEFRSISPWDFWYSPDSPDTQRGTGVFVRQRWTRKNLIEAAKMKSYIQENILDILMETDKNKNFNYKWTSGNPDQSNNDMINLWKHCGGTIDVLIHYGFFSGKELRKYNVTDVEDTEFYNATVTVINDKTIQVVVQKNPNVSVRPIYTASFYGGGTKIPGSGIPQRMRDVERCYNTVLRYLVLNSANASGPITEADYGRLSKYMTDDDIARLIPNTTYLSDSEINSNSPALRFYSIPSVMGPYLQVLDYFQNLAHSITNVPASLNGTAQGSGANRTFRGAALFQGNAVKQIQSSVANVDQFVFSPLGQLIYSYNMLYEKDASIKGDCKIMAQGATGLLQREINRQNSAEILQLVASAGAQLDVLENPSGLFGWALGTLLGNMGVPEQFTKIRTTPIQTEQAPLQGEVSGPQQPALSAGQGAVTVGSEITGV